MWTASGIRSTDWHGSTLLEFFRADWITETEIEPTTESQTYGRQPATKINATRKRTQITRMASKGHIRTAAAGAQELRTTANAFIWEHSIPPGRSPSVLHKSQRTLRPVCLQRKNPTTSMAHPLARKTNLNVQHPRWKTHFYPAGTTPSSLQYIPPIKPSPQSNSQLCTIPS